MGEMAEWDFIMKYGILNCIIHWTKPSPAKNRSFWYS